MYTPLSIKSFQNLFTCAISINSAPPPNPTIVVTENVQQGHIESVAARQYIKKRPNVLNIHPFSDQLFIIVKMSTIGGNVSNEITNEVNLFGLIMH